MLTFADVHWPLQMCEAYMEFTCYTICIPAIKCRRMKEMLLYLFDAELSEAEEDDEMCTTESSDDEFEIVFD